MKTGLVNKDETGVLATSLLQSGTPHPPPPKNVTDQDLQLGVQRQSHFFIPLPNTVASYTHPVEVEGPLLGLPALPLPPPHPLLVAKRDLATLLPKPLTFHSSYLG